MTDIQRINNLTQELEALSSLNATEVAEWAMKHLRSVADDYGEDGKRARELLDVVAKLLDL